MQGLKNMHFKKPASQGKKPQENVLQQNERANQVWDPKRGLEHSALQRAQEMTLRAEGMRPRGVPRGHWCDRPEKQPAKTRLRGN